MVLFTESSSCSNTTLIVWWCYSLRVHLAATQHLLWYGFIHWEFILQQHYCTMVLFTEGSPCNNANVPWCYSLRVHLEATQRYCALVQHNATVPWCYSLRVHLEATQRYCALVLFTESSSCSNATLLCPGVIHWEFILQQLNSTVPWCYSLRVHLAATQHYCALVLFTKSSSCNNTTLLCPGVIHEEFILQQPNTTVPRCYSLSVHLAATQCYCAMVLFTKSSPCSNTTLIYHGVIHWKFTLQVS